MNEIDDDSPYEMIIEAHPKGLGLDLKSLFHYRDLLWLMVRRDLVLKYKQTFLGPLWVVLQPLLVTLVFSVVFARIVRVPTGGVPAVLFYLSSLLPWLYFSQSFNAISVSLLEQAPLFGKVYFPRLIVPISLVLSHLITFLIQLLVFSGVYFLFKEGIVGGENPLSLSLGGLPFLLLQTASLSLGVGLLFSAVTVKYRDLKNLLGILTQIWLYATPVIYPLSIVPEKWKWLMAINPMAWIIETYRHVFLGLNTLHLGLGILSILMTLLILAAGIIAFQKVERTFVDTV
ncbi:MAG: ABC transporter permease [Chlamydiae bacterium]|nr:ABC transporter permease [Chlamydiota bacterium]MBI3277306.1 ABC transporter permease [Chlamydiota bacterium]